MTVTRRNTTLYALLLKTLEVVLPTQVDCGCHGQNHGQDLCVPLQRSRRRGIRRHGSQPESGDSSIRFQPSAPEHPDMEKRPVNGENHAVYPDANGFRSHPLAEAGEASRGELGAAKG